MRDIANNDALTDEEKREELSKIQSGMEAAISNLAAKQVAIDNDLLNFETGTNQWNGAIEDQMNMLGGVLKEEQHQFLTSKLEQKEELRVQTEGLLELLNEESSTQGADMEAQRT